MKIQGREAIRYGIPSIFLLIGVVWSWKLIVSRIVGEWCFLAIVIVSVIGSLFIAFSDRVKEIALGLKESRLILAETRESEKEVRALAKEVIDLVEAATAGSLVTDKFDSDRYDKAIEKLKKRVAQTS